jgi:hypothetical protein
MTPAQIFEAARLWGHKMDTQEIAVRLRIPEAWVFAQMPAIRAAASAQRNVRMMVPA